MIFHATFIKSLYITPTPTKNCNVDNFWGHQFQFWLFLQFTLSYNSNLSNMCSIKYQIVKNCKNWNSWPQKLSKMAFFWFLSFQNCFRGTFEIWAICQLLKNRRKSNKMKWRTRKRVLAKSFVKLLSFSWKISVANIFRIAEITHKFCGKTSVKSTK